MCIIYMQCLQSLEEASDPLELKLEALVSCSPWILGIELCMLFTVELSLKSTTYQNSLNSKNKHNYPNKLE